MPSGRRSARPEPGRMARAAIRLKFSRGLTQTCGDLATYTTPLDHRVGLSVALVSLFLRTLEANVVVPSSVTRQTGPSARLLLRSCLVPLAESSYRSLISKRMTFFRRIFAHRSIVPTTRHHAGITGSAAFLGDWKPISRASLTQLSGIGHRHRGGEVKAPSPIPSK